MGDEIRMGMMWGWNCMKNYFTPHFLITLNQFILKNIKRYKIYYIFI